MSQDNHSPIVVGANANASIVNSPLGQLDAAIGALTSLPTTDKTSLVAAINENFLTDVAQGTSITILTGWTQGLMGGSTVTAQQLKDWTEGGAYEILTITYDTNYTDVVSTATVKWPDGSTGTFTTTTLNITFLSVDAYTVTHTTSAKTVTQAAVTRDDDGKVLIKPALTVA